LARSHTPSFTTLIPLTVTPSQEKKLLARLEAARQVYNACLGECLKRLRLLRQSKAYQAARKLPRGAKRTEAFRKANTAVGFREYDLHSYAKQFGSSWLGDCLDSHVIQKLSTRAFDAVKGYALGKKGCPHFKKKGQVNSVEGKTNGSGIRWRDDHVEWLGLHLQAVIDPEDPVIEHGLDSPVKYVRIIRRKIKGRNRFYVQLLNERYPYQKPKNKLGEGEVGLDVGPSTIAAVSENEAFLARFCDELEDTEREIRRLQRKIDRQRRANNPQNYLPDGSVKPGVKHWHKSKRQLETEAKLSELCRKQAAHRKSLHGRLANRIMGMGDTFHCEDISPRAFQRRYGKSVQMRAPGKFLEMLRRKIAAAGEVDEFPTSLRLSQLCHGCGTVKKKPLSQRWHKCSCGVVAQRDLYSAFLAMCVEGDRLNVAKARELWPGVESLLTRAMLSLEEQLANGKEMPSSFGLSRRKSQSPAEAGGAKTEAQDVVG